MTSRIRFPVALRPGDRIGVTAPSAGVEGAGVARMEFCVDWLRQRGYDVVVGDCLVGSGVTSAPVAERAAELTAMLCDPTIRCVVPPWGGETAIDIIDKLDWVALAQAEPTWIVGYSDSATWMLPFTTRLGWATIHGDNLADTPYAVPEGLAHWLTFATGATTVTQRDSGLIATWVRFEDDPRATTWVQQGAGTWRSDGDLQVSGRLIGGCLDTLANVAGTPYGDVATLGERHAETGLIVYVEVCADSALEVCRKLHGLQLAGWFDHANAVLVGRTSAPDDEDMTQDQAIDDALGQLGIPIVRDLEIGHVPPHLPLVNGAMATVTIDGERREIVQELR